MSFVTLFECLEKYVECLEEYLSITETKINAIKENDSSFLDEIVRKEQPFLLKIKSFESKRLKLFSELGYEEYSMQQFVDSCPLEHKQQAQTITNTIQEKVLKIKANNLCITDLLALKLYKLNELINEGNIKSKSMIYQNA